MRSIGLVSLSLSVFATLAVPALGVDGVLEINQACAAGDGCFSGDSAGFPVTIDGSAGRSYRLTGDLLVPDENTDGIRLDNVNDVSIDLGGFRIVRSGCENATTSCAVASGTGSGVHAINALGDLGVSVRDGSIIGMGDSGIALGARSHVSGIRARWNRRAGIFLQRNATVIDCVASENVENGFLLQQDSYVAGNTAYLNGEWGIDAGTAGGSSVFTGNTLTHNGVGGLRAGPRSTVSLNTAAFNGDSLPNSGWGFFLESGSTVSDNTVSTNQGTGIKVNGAGSLVHGNAIDGNTDLGLELSPGSGYRENVISGNLGTVGGGGVDMGDNVCETNTTCP